jgi:hypothetical protein
VDIAEKEPVQSARLPNNVVADVGYRLVYPEENAVFPSIFHIDVLKCKIT